MEFIQDYALFLVKALTLVILAIVLLGFVIAMISRGRDGEDAGEQLTVKHLNERYRDMEAILRQRILGKKAQRRHEQTLKRQAKMRHKEAASEDDPHIFVLRFHGDIRASRVDSLREEVSAILTLARPALDRVVVCIDSGGGMVPSYGLAAAQVARLRQAGLDVTAAVDRIAASGGYMMAAVAQRIIAAPFAIVGSIGVVAQIPNLHRLLKRHDIDIELMTAGQYKRTLTVLGENTPEGRAKFQQDLNETHSLFKDHLLQFRPQLDIDRLATGEHWYGQQALDLQLVDELQTSDDLLMGLTRAYEVFEVRYSRKQSLGQRLGLAAEHGIDQFLARFMGVGSARTENTETHREG